MNQQFIGKVEGVVAQSISGSQHFGVEAAQLIDAISRFGGTRAAELSTAVHELEDPGAPAPVRLGAKQKLLSFLARSGPQLGTAALKLMVRYIEDRPGF